MGVFENRRFLRKSEKKLFSQKNQKKNVQKKSYAYLIERHTMTN